MSIKSTQKIVFKQKTRDSFDKDLLRNVEQYFKEKGIHKKGNSTLLFKGILSFVLVIASYIAIYLVPPTLFWILTSYILLGFFSVVLVFNLGHDAMHGAASKNPKINKLLGYSWNLAGMSSYIWQLRHNYAHHSFTNVPGTDYDVAQSALLRLNPYYPRKKFHRYQHIYGPILMSLLTLNLALFKDFQMLKETRFGNKVVTHTRSQKIRIVLLKVFFLTYSLVLPLIFVDAAPWIILLSYFFYHITSGLFVSAVLVPAHLHPDTYFEQPNEQGVIDQSWLGHQLEVTVDFSTHTPVVGWLTGGLNYHIAHHIFPYICHVHYGPITRIIKNTAKAHGKQYINKSWGALIGDTITYLKDLGNSDDVSKYLAVPHK